MCVDILELLEDIELVFRVLKFSLFILCDLVFWDIDQ